MDIQIKMPVSLTSNQVELITLNAKGVAFLLFSIQNCPWLIEKEGSIKTIYDLLMSGI